MISAALFHVVASFISTLLDAELTVDTGDGEFKEGREFE